jgi:uncharacterized protein YnzC (UPF0291/DUF896 family)
VERLIGRINELSRKSKTVGLSESEKAERDQLRKQYLEIFRNNFRNELERIEFVDNKPDLKH